MTADTVFDAASLTKAVTTAPAVMILHGAGSRKENHSDFARLAVNNGFAALSFDNRGHGASEGELVGAAESALRRYLESGTPGVFGERVVLDGDRQTISQNEDIKEFYLGLSGVGQRKSYRDVKHYKRRKRWLS